MQRLSSATSRIISTLHNALLYSITTRATIAPSVTPEAPQRNLLIALARSDLSVRFVSASLSFHIAFSLFWKNEFSLSLSDLQTLSATSSLGVVSLTQSVALLNCSIPMSAPLQCASIPTFKMDACLQSWSLASECVVKLINKRSVVSRLNP